MNGEHVWPPPAQPVNRSARPEMIWAPPEWCFNCFPLPAEGQEILTMDVVISTLQAHLDTVTEADTTALGRALHVGHMLTAAQSGQGDWPAVFNARTGEWIGAERSLAPLALFRRMNKMLNSTEFDHVISGSLGPGVRKVGPQP